LFPTPGSPPISTSEPGTIPPPSTRPNSSIPTASRSKSATSISSRRSGRLGTPVPAATATRGRADGLAAAVARTTRSSRVFQAWHSGQRPLQRAALAPQSRQTYSVLAFATWKSPHPGPLPAGEGAVNAKGASRAARPLQTTGLLSTDDYAVAAGSGSGSGASRSFTS